MNSRTLVIHPGMAKAGSTALQTGLSQAYEPLLRNGIWYPLETGHNTHHKLFNQNSVFSASPISETDEISEWNQIAEKSFAVGAKYTVLSSEILYARAHEHGYLEHLRQYLNAWDRLTFVLVLRHQVDWIESAFIEALRSPDWAYIPYPETIISTSNNSLIKGAQNSKISEVKVEPDYAKTIERFQNVFPKAKLATLDYQTVKSSAAGIVFDVLNAAEIPIPEQIKDQKPNPQENITPVSPFTAIVAQKIGVRLTPEVCTKAEAIVLQNLPKARYSTIYTKQELVERLYYFDTLNDGFLKNQYVTTGFRSRFHQNPPKIFRDDLSAEDWRRLTHQVAQSLDES